MRSLRELQWLLCDYLIIWCIFATWIILLKLTRHCKTFMFTKTSLQLRFLIAKILNYMYIKILYKFYIVILNLIIHCKLCITQKLIFLIFGWKSKMFIWVSHIYVPAQSHNWTVSWSSSPNCISHLDTPIYHPILLAWSVLNINQGHHRFVGAEGLWVVGPLLVTITILCSLFLFLLANGAVQSPCAFLISWSIGLWFH